MIKAYTKTPGTRLTKRTRALGKGQTCRKVPQQRAGLFFESEPGRGVEPQQGLACHEKRVRKNPHTRKGLAITAVIGSSQDAAEVQSKSRLRIKTGSERCNIIIEQIQQTYAHRYMHRKVSSMSI